MDSVQLIKHFMEPRSVALVGVPRRTGRGTFNILENLMGAGYKGKPFPVNPNAGEIMGIKAYPTVLDIPEVPDLAVMMLPRQAVPETVKHCAQRGIRAAIVVSDGFDEAGDDEGRRLQRDVERIAGEGGVHLVGPNSLGVVNNYAPFTSTFLPVASERVPVALVSQSGGLFAGFHEFIMGKGLDLGNMCDVGFSDALEYFAHDPDIKVVVLHIEGMKQGRPFFQAARRLAGLKPVLVLKTGRSEAGSRAIASHTGSLTGEDQVYSALARQTGLIRVDSVDDVCDFTKAFLHLPPPKGNRLGILTPSGGAAIMALDVLGHYDFQMARLSADTVGRLQEFWSPWSTPGNPLDMMSPGVMHGYKKMYSTSLQAMLDDPGVDIVLCIAGTPTLKTVKGAIEATGRWEKPVVSWAMGRWDEAFLSQLNAVDYRAVFHTPERALRAMAVVRDFYRRNGLD